MKKTSNEDENKVLPFQVESESRNRFERGLGDFGTRTTIIEWSKVPGIRGHSCPECGYDRVKRTLDYNPTEKEDSEEHECMACGLNAERFIQERERAYERARQEAGGEGPRRTMSRRERRLRRSKRRDDSRYRPR